MSPEHRRIDAIVALTKQFSCSPAAAEAKVIVGVTELDDCAVVRLSDHLDLAVGSDFVRGEGFTLFQMGLLTREHIGRYLVGANLSDIAAMGALPVGILVAARYTSNLTDDEFSEIMRGVTKACQDYSAPLLGGDTGSYESSVLSAAAIGVCPTGTALLRKNGVVSDALYLSGSVGTAGAALAIFRDHPKLVARLSPGDVEKLLHPWRNVSPAIAHGALLTREGLSRCAIDTSDGLATACRQLAAASNVAIELNADDIPFGFGVRELSETLGADHVSIGCGDSVDFRLLFTCDPVNCDRLELRMKQSGLEYHRIGRLVEFDGTSRVLVKRAGEIKSLAAKEKIM